MAKISDEVRGVCPKICHPSWCQEKKTRTTLAFRAILTIIVEMEGTDSNLLISLIILMFQNPVFRLVSDFDQ